MFTHVFKYSLKTLFKNKMLIFWTFAFPIILGTFFNLAFSNIEKSEEFKVIKIAVINNDSFNNNLVFKNSIKELSKKENKNRLFSTRYVTQEKCEKLLKDKKITGYIEIVNDTPNIVVNNSGLEETILKYAVEEINEASDIINNTINAEISKGVVDYNKIYSKVQKLVSADNVKLNNKSNKNLGYTMIEFYTLIAMTCLYGGIISMTSVNQNLANMSSKGKRISVAPVSKIRTILASLLASYIVQVLGILLLFIYTLLVLNVDYGNDLMKVLILSLVGSFAGLSLGVFVASVFKKNEGTKSGIVIAVSMLCSFFSGMMGITMKYVIDKNIPILNKINPVSMITDGLYSLYYYDTLNRYIFNIISLLVFSFILIALSINSLRRQKYDSI